MAGVAATLALVWTSFLASPARAADSAPDWLRQAAQEKLPEHDKDAVAVILLDEVQNTIRDNGEIDVRHRRAIRLLRPEAREDFGSIDVDFDKDTKISSLNAWTIDAAGHEIAVGEKDSVEHGFLSDIEYTDIKVKALNFPEGNPGSIVGYEYVQRQRPYVFEDRWAFQKNVPVKSARFILDLPPGWEFSALWFNHSEEQPQSGSGHYVWELHDIAAMEVEPDMPPWRTVAGWAGIKYFPRDPALRAKTSGSWKDIGIWYAGLTQSSRISSPQISQKVAELTAGISNPLQKIRAVTDYMQKNIRYMAVEIGIGGYQPHPAAEVFTHQFGDCKDKATLLSTMLHEIGIESYYVVVDTDRGFILSDYPSIHSMNHVILAIKLPDTIPDGTLGPLIHDPQLGRLLVFDPTNEYVPLGDLPWYLQANYGLLVAPDGGTLVSLPLTAPPLNRLLRQAQFQLNPDGDLTGDVRELEWGAPASDERRKFLRAEPAKRPEVFEHFLGGFLTNFVLTGASLGNLDRYDQVLALNYKFIARRYANSAGDLLLLRPRILGDGSTYLLDLFAEKKPRKYPIQFEEATQQSDIFDIALPAGYALDGVPDPVQADCDFASYHSKITVSGGTLHYERTLVIKGVMVPTEKLSQVRQFLQQVAADQESTVILRHTAN